MKGWPDWSARWTSNWARRSAAYSGKQLEVFVQLGPFAVFLAQDDLVVNQVEQVVVAERWWREFFEKGFDGKSFSFAPALAVMVDKR